MSLRDMFVNIGYNVRDRELRGVNNAVNRLRGDTLSADRATNKFERSVDKAGKQLDQLKRKSKSTGAGLKSLATKALGVTTAYLGIKGISNAINDWTTAAKAQIDAETKLQAVLKNTKGVTDEQIDGLKKFAGEMQNVGVIGDEVAIAGMQQIGTFQLQAKTIKTLTPGMEDLLAQQKGLNATQGDAVTIGNLIGKVMGGQVGALSRVGISFTKAQEKVLKYGSEEERAAMLAKVLEQNVGGVNKALRETDQGKIQAMTNAWGDMKEELGKKVLPLQGKLAAWFEIKIPRIQDTLTKFLDVGVTKFDKLTSFVDSRVIPTLDDLGVFIGREIKPRFEEVGKVVGEIGTVFFSDMNNSAGDLKLGLGDLVTDGLDLVIEGLKWIRDNQTAVQAGIKGLTGLWLVQKGTLIVLAAARTANTTATLIGIGADKAETIAIYGLITAEKIQLGWTKAVTAAQWLWNAALSANPIGLVIVGIAALGTGLYVLYKKWDKVTGAVKKAWDWLTKWNKTSVKDKKVGVTQVAGNSSKIGHNANGTNNWHGGWTWVGERGKELVNLPRGSKIFPHDESVSMYESAFRGQNARAQVTNTSNTIRSNQSEKVVKITYAPQQNFYGVPSNMVQQIKDVSKETFEQMMKQYFHSVALEG